MGRNHRTNSIYFECMYMWICVCVLCMRACVQKLDTSSAQHVAFAIRQKCYADLLVVALRIRAIYLSCVVKLLCKWDRKRVLIVEFTFIIIAIKICAGTHTFTSLTITHAHTYHIHI